VLHVKKKIELIAPIEIIKFSKNFYNSSLDHGASIRDQLIQKMRKDLDSCI